MTSSNRLKSVVFYRVTWTFALFLITLALLIGYALGVISTGLIVKSTIVDSIDKLKIENVNLGFNETYIMDRFENISKQLKTEVGNSSHD